MKRSRAWSYGVALTAGILLTTGMNGTEADAAAIDGGKITIDYANQKLKVEGATDSEIFFATATAKAVKGKDYKKITPSAWDTYDYDAAKGITIDLSFLNRAKENYIQIKGDINTDPVTIQIPAVLSKVSASYDTKTATVTMSDIRDKKNPVELKDDAIEYRTVYSGWQNYSAGDSLSMYQQRGAKLYFRVKAKDAQKLNSIIPESAVMVDTDNNLVAVYKASSFPGVEKLVTVKKEAAAPKVTVDYAKHQFSVPKTVEYRVVASSKTNWTTVKSEEGTKAKTVQLNLSDIVPDNATEAALEVRVAATDKTVASKIQRIGFKLPEKTSIFSAQGKKTGTFTGDELLENDFFDNAVGTNEADLPVVPGCVYDKKTKAVTGILFDNESQDAYEICVVRKEDGRPAPNVTGLYTLKAKGAKATKNVMLTIKIEKLKDGDKLYIRKKADTKTMTWSSDFAGFGTVNFDAMSE